MKTIVAACRLLLLLTLLQTGCGKPDETGQPVAKAQVPLAEISLRNLADVVELSAEIEGYQSAELVSRVEGYVGDVLVDIGDQKAQGDLLAVLHAPELTAELERRKRLVDKALTDLASRQAELKQADSQLAEQQAMLRLRQSQLARVSSLVEFGSLNQEKQDEAQYAVESVLAAIQRCTADIAAAEAHVRGAKADIAVAEAESNKAQAQAGYLRITAPFDGRITQRHVDPGAFVRPADRGGSPLLSIESVDPVRVVIYLPTADAAKLDVGDKLVLKGIDALAGRELSGAITRYADSFQRGSRMMRAEVDLENPVDPKSGKRLLKPGDYGKVTLTLAEFPGIAVVPLGAIGQSKEGSYVMLLDKDLRCRRQWVDVKIVATIDVDGQLQQVAGIVGALEDLGVGQRVITKNLGDYQHGQELTPDKYSIAK